MNRPPDRSIRLLFLNQTLGMGGAESFNHDLLAWLKHHQVQITAYVNFLPLAKRLSDSDIDVHLQPLVIDIIGDWKGLVKGIFFLPFAIIRYLNILSLHKHTDVVLMSGYIEKIIVTPLAKMFNLPVVWIEYAPLSTIFPKFFGLPGFLYRCVNPLCDYLVVPSNHTLTQNANLINFPAHRIVKIPCASPPPPKYTPAADPHVITCVSRLEPGKGQDVLIQSWPQVLAKFPHSLLHIVGEGDFAVPLKNLVATLHLEKSVRFLGRVPVAAQVMSESAICVFPSLWPLEGFGLVITEAMSVKRPVVAFSIGPAPEIITPQTGILVEPGNVSALAAALIKLLSSPALAAKMGQAGFNHWSQHYTLDQVGPAYLKVLNLAISRHHAQT